MKNGSSALGASFKRLRRKEGSWEDKKLGKNKKKRNKNLCNLRVENLVPGKFFPGWLKLIFFQYI